MQLGMIGLGRIGLHMVRRLLGDGHAWVVHDVQAAPVAGLVKAGRNADAATVEEVFLRCGPHGAWLLDLTATALLKDPKLAECGGQVSDSGAGRCTIQAAIDEGVPVPVPVLSAALFERFTSRGNANFASQVLSAMQSEFGGHAEKPAP